MAKLSSFPSGPVESGDYFIGSTQKGKTKKITMSSVIASTKDAINTLDNFAVDIQITDIHLAGIETHYL